MVSSIRLNSTALYYASCLSAKEFKHDLSCILVYFSNSLLLFKAKREDTMVTDPPSILEPPSPFSLPASTAVENRLVI